LSTRFPYKEYRKGQEEVASHVKEAVENNEILLLEAPTGFGKTAAVIDGLERGGAEKVLWVVRTVNQVDPVIRELRRFGLRHTYVFSARRTCPLTMGKDVPVEDFWMNCRYLRSQGRCSFYQNTMEAGHGGGVEGNYSL
jgi:DNA excision repair protein ERCC-2